METVQKTRAKRSLLGIVVSVAAKNTAVVRVDTMKMHLKYKKQYRVSRKYHVHDAKSEAGVGDTVRFVECRPISKTKRWYVDEVIKKAV